MLVEVSTDNNVEGRDALIARVTTAVRDALGRFEGRLTRVEVHLGDVNSEKAGARDKRCMVEARPRGRRPKAATHRAASLEEALTGALAKLRRGLESTLGKDRTRGRDETVRKAKRA